MKLSLNLMNNFSPQLEDLDVVSALLTIDVNRTKTQLEEANSTTIKVR